MLFVKPLDMLRQDCSWLILHLKSIFISNMDAVTTRTLAVVAIRQIILRPMVSFGIKPFWPNNLIKANSVIFNKQSISWARTIPLATAIITDEVTGTPLILNALIVSIIFFLITPETNVGLPLFFIVISSE